MNSRLYILGAGGHGRVVAECAQLSGKYQTISFLDDKYPGHTNNMHWPIVGELDHWQSLIGQGDFIVAIGVNKFRLALSDAIADAGGDLATIIHPRAVVSPNASIGAGSVVCANAIVTIGALIERACIVNTGASVDHDCHLGAGVHVSPGCRIAGQVNVGQAAWLGIGSTINECLSVGEHTILGGGASLIHDAQAHSLYVGVPAIKK